MPSVSTIVVSLILIAIVALIVRNMVKEHKSGVCHCGSSCGSCGGNCHCSDDKK